MAALSHFTVIIEIVHACKIGYFMDTKVSALPLLLLYQHKILPTQICGISRVLLHLLQDSALHNGLHSLDNTESLMQRSRHATYT